MSMTNEELVKLIKSGKQEYSEQLYKQNKGIILKHAKKYSKHADIDDFIQEGYIALIKAANGFDESLEYKFTTYLEKTIKRHFRDYYLKNCVPVHIPNNVISRISDFQKFKNGFFMFKEREPTKAECMRALNLTRAQLESLLETMQEMNVMSLNEPVDEDEEIELVELIADGKNLEEEISDSSEEQYIHDVLIDCIQKLSEPQRDVIFKRYFNNMTQAKIAGIRGCSSTYISDIERAAKRALKKSLEMNELIYSCYDCRSSYHGSVGRFNCDGLSSTEYIVEKKLEIQERLDSLLEQERKALEERIKELTKAKAAVKCPHQDG